MSAVTGAVFRPWGTRGRSLALRLARGVAWCVLLLGVALALGSCNESEPCVPGFEVGHTYKVTVLGRYEEGRSLVSRAHPFGTCGMLGDLDDGNELSLRFEEISGPGIDCKVYGGRIVGATSFEVLRHSAYAGTSYLSTRSKVAVVAATALVALPGGCEGGVKLELGVPDRTNPFALQPDDKQRRVVLVRAFGVDPPDPRCARPGSTLFTSESMHCLDVFEVSISR